MPTQYPLALSLMDFLPPLFFLAGAGFLVRLARLERAGGSIRLLIAGGTLVFLGGFLKAIWKLLVALQIADIRVLAEQQFVLLAPGFLLMFIGVLHLVQRREAPSGVTAMAAWKIPFLAVMTISSIGMNGILTWHAFQRRQRLAGWMFIVTVLCLFGMAGMSSAPQTIALQWIEESINLLAQAAFLGGCYLLQSQRVSQTKTQAMPLPQTQTDLP
ncbi:MAG: hypothetical protein D6755_07645 [Anaerolineae bacterium]|nr:MAG: hypothetical protein D6755_07645 [Anaerolineae bacterium]